ncbi:hypothetical protein [Nonomuraea wenchangensis]|uniref:hypothetical protein n=1 Tax=Nonomuraea wenchangensis TaxID=568860 RepID=UPI00379DE864
MRRYRFGRIAAFFAVGYVTAVVVAGVLALVTGDPALLRAIVATGWDADTMTSAWWVEVLLVAGGVVQGWAYWQVLRGRPAGTPAANDRPVRLLRAALYLGVVSMLLPRLPIPYLWWSYLPADLLQVAVVCLFFVALAGVLPRPLRLVGLVAGLADTVMDVAATFIIQFGTFDLLKVVSSSWLGDLVHLLWLVPVLAGQARDARWTRGTVRVGAATAALSLLSSGGHSFITFGGELDPSLVLFMLIGVLGVLAAAWQARSAHDLGAPAPEPAPPAPVRVAPAPARAWTWTWPFAAVAVALPLIPAAVNLADGMPAWIGPRGLLDELFHGYVSEPATLLWVALDLLVGVGAPAVLVLVAVVRRTRGLLRITTAALTLAAAAGVVTAITTPRDTDWLLIPEVVEQRLRWYPDGLFVPDAEGGFGFGISPLWYSAALAGSALVLFFLYAPPPAARPRHQVVMAAPAVAVALCLLPAADQSRGPVTTAADCSPAQPWERAGESREPVPRTGPRAYLCAVRQHQALGFAATTPDQVVLTYGRRLCAAYTRADPAELARLRNVEGVNVRGLNWALAGICPAADADVRAEDAAEDREFAEFQAEERRKCAATPRHRPLIRPVKAVRLREPEWPEAGLELYDEYATEGRSTTAGPVESGPGHVRVSTHSDFHVCVTLETYTRRPPVETKGWADVVEVGYLNRTGEMVFMDGLSGSVLPDLSLGGRKGHYRIRVHYAWFPWKDEGDGTQRLLIMAYPGPGDQVTTYRKPRQRR